MILQRFLMNLRRFSTVLQRFLAFLLQLFSTILQQFSRILRRFYDDSAPILHIQRLCKDYITIIKWLYNNYLRIYNNYNNSTYRGLKKTMILQRIQNNFNFLEYNIKSKHTEKVSHLFIYLGS